MKTFGRVTGRGHLVSRDDSGCLILYLEGWKTDSFPGGVNGWIRLDEDDPVEAIRMARWVLLGEAPDRESITFSLVANPHPGRIYATLDRIIRVPRYVPRVDRS